MATTTFIEMQQTPHMVFTRNSSNMLWIVELIQRRRWESRILNVCGTIVQHDASGMKVRLLSGKCFRRRVVNIRSSPRWYRFFSCSVSMSLRLYSYRTGSPGSRGVPSSAMMRYMVKQPGRQVTQPNAASKAFFRWWEL